MNILEAKLNERASILFQARDNFIEPAYRDGRDPSGEERMSFDRAILAFERLGNEVRQIEAAEERSRYENRVWVDADTTYSELRNMKSAWKTFVENGNIVSPLRSLNLPIPMSRREYRDTIAATDSKGGFLALPMSLTKDVYRADRNNTWFGSMVEAAGSWKRMKDGKDLGIRKRVTGISDADWGTEVASVAEDTAGQYGRRS